MRIQHIILTQPTSFFVSGLANKPAIPASQMIKNTTIPRQMINVVKKPKSR